MELTPVAEGSVGLTGVTRAFGGRRVIDALTLEAGPGEIVGLVGANGSGKTTALRLIAGTLAPDGGSVVVCGEPAGRGATAFVPAGDRGLYWRISVRENLRFFAALRRERDRLDERVEAAAEATGIASVLDVRAEACSTGQRRRAMLARALVSGPPVLVVDEPFEGLDEAGIAAARSALSGWAEHGGVVAWAAPTVTGGPPSARVIEVGG